MVDVTGYQDVEFPMGSFIALTVYSEAGGTYKTTTVANTATALARKGLDVLVVDLDPQEGCLSYMFDVDDQKSNPEADHLLRHITDQPKGEFGDLIKPSGEGFDILPSHNKLLKFGTQLENMERMAKMNQENNEFNKYAQLRQTLGGYGVHKKYDALLIDPQATASDKLYNAIYATRTLLSPVEPSGKGSLALDGLEDLVDGMEKRLNITIGVAAVVPQDVGGTSSSESYTEEVQGDEWDVPIVVGQRESMMKEMWDARGSAYKVIDEGWRDGEPDQRRSPSDGNVQTLRKFDELADHIIDLYHDVEQTQEVEA